MRRTVDLRWLRRTFARLDWLAGRVDAEELAKVLVEHSAAQDAKVQRLRDYLSDLWHFVERLQPPRPEQPCAVCGGDKWINDIDRSDARYGSAACRQRAYRQRVTSHSSRRITKPSQTAVCDTSLHLSATRSITSIENRPNSGDG